MELHAILYFIFLQFIFLQTHLPGNYRRPIFVQPILNYIKLCLGKHPDSI